MRGTEAVVSMISTLEYANAVDEKHASDLTQAHLIETLSSLGREHIDFYFLRVRRAAEEFQISGALQALEMARQEGHIRYFGVCCDGPALATLGLWQFHDAFEVALIPRNHYDASTYRTLEPMARERRVGVVTSRPLNWGYGLPFLMLPDLWRLKNLTRSFYGISLAQAVLGDLSREHPVMVGVRTPNEIAEAVACRDLTVPAGLSTMLDEYINAFRADETWAEMESHSNPFIQEAARRRRRSIA